MSIRTFGDAWRRVQLQAPGAPATLAQAWVQEAYDELAGKRHWAWLKAESILNTLASRSATITFTQASTAITSAAAFVSTDAGRQIRVGTGTPTYTIDTVTNPSAAVLTGAFKETGGAQTATISDVYLVMPADFRSIYDVTDLVIQRPIAWWISRERLDLFDPARISSDTRFRVMASNMFSDATATAGQIRYELWPRPTAVASYVMQYFKRSDQLADTDTFKGVLATKIEALIEGALAKCARWPGTVGQKNPYFNLALADKHELKFLQGCRTLDIIDDDQYLDDLQQIDLAKFGLAAISADCSLLRQSDATIGDYY